MRIRALCSFSGNIAMCKGEVREYSNETVLSDLLQAGYVEEVTETVEEVTETTETTRKPRKKAVKAVEDQ